MMNLKSYAKINLFLDVIGVDDRDHYHQIHSLFQEISLWDEIEIVKSELDSIRFEKVVIEGKTTLHKALELFKEKFRIRDCFNIIINKNIPVGAGLGGGSSNAAYTLMGLASYYSIPVRELIDIGQKIGSDVTYFFYGGLCKVEGKGEIVKPLESQLENIRFIVVYPNIGISTKWAYSLIDNYQINPVYDRLVNNSIYNIDFLKGIVYNKFEEFVFNKNAW